MTPPRKRSRYDDDRDAYYRDPQQVWREDRDREPRRRDDRRPSYRSGSASRSRDDYDRERRRSDRPIQSHRGTRDLEEGELSDFKRQSRASTPLQPIKVDTPPSNTASRLAVQHIQGTGPTPNANVGDGVENESHADFDIAMRQTTSEPDLQAVMAEKRRKRQEILAKYAAVTASAKPLVQTVTTVNTLAAAANSDQEEGEVLPSAKRLRLDSPLSVNAIRSVTPVEQSLKNDASNMPSPSTPKPDERSGVDTPDYASDQEERQDDAALLNLAKGAGDEGPPRVDATSSSTNLQDEISAADYNPDEDRRQDDARQLAHQGGVQDHAAGHVGATALAELESTTDQRQAKKIDGDDDEEEEIEVEVEEEAVDDEDDMFAVPVKRKKIVKVRKGKNAARNADNNMVVITRTNATGSAPIDDQDDAEGYYRVILGELLDGSRYHVHANLGKGMFSSVVRAKDTSDNNREVAIKMIRSQETMYKAGLKEVGILDKLRDADPTDKKHIVRLERTFEHRGHLCLVFESLSMNLREVVKRFGKDVGINLRAVRAYAHQMFLGLNLMKRCNIMHADIKPDNLLVNDNHSQLKISDLGSASDVSENEITPYLVSRFYRSPEIILGLPYDCSLDMWAIGCTLYELYTGKILFPGRNNNQMLLLIQELKGRINNRFIKKSRFGDVHYDEQGNFITSELNKATGTESMKKVNLPAKAASDLKARLMPLSQLKRMAADDAKLLTNFVDLLDKALDLDPAKRLTPKDALMHPFMR